MAIKTKPIEFLGEPLMEILLHQCNSMKFGEVSKNVDVCVCVCVTAVCIFQLNKTTVVAMAHYAISYWSSVFNFLHTSIFIMCNDINTRLVHVEIVMPEKW